MRIVLPRSTSESPRPSASKPKPTDRRRVVGGRDQHVEVRIVEQFAHADRAGAQVHRREIHPVALREERVANQPAEHRLLQGVDADDDVFARGRADRGELPAHVPKNRFRWRSKYFR